MTTTTNTATIVKATFNGGTGAGAVAVSGLNVGDVMVRCVPDGFTSGFEPVISVAGQIQQNAAPDWSSVQFIGYFLRGV
ncbi:hypothetical protein [Burkholderia sp. B21-007]|uniref:hypothetical protein n=1 Tax=Burkholderia sp. B21-007 TaxID=2890407 RepID=UPI001E39E814|nr:hypothetical protein [Burkholderia sp. B21-007]UEP31611.1 hypothetical protein LMA01_20605 [Burkholderia sp. B21-007]